MSNLRDFFPPVTPAIQPFMQVQDQKATGTQGGASVVGDNHRDLNTVMQNDIVGASLASNLVTLPAGTYYAEAECVAYASDYFALSIKDSADAEVVSRGLGLLTAAANVNLIHWGAVSGQFILAAETQVKVVLYVQTANAVGLGGISNIPPYELYTDLRIWQLKEGI